MRNKAYLPVALRREVATDSDDRCGYCLTPQEYTGIELVHDHIIPESLGGKTVRENLWLACRRCNQHKYTRTEGVDPITQQTVPLYNPRTQSWSVHFVWSETGTEIVGVTPIGRATVKALKMNNHVVVKARAHWVRWDWHPPKD